MGIFGADNNKTSLAYESGTYGYPMGSSFWAGRVQDFSPDDNQNIQRIRYHGTNTRNIDKSYPGNEDYGGSLEVYPDDFRLLMFALGNGSDTTIGSPDYYTHILTELNNDDSNPFTSGARNPFSSFCLESLQHYTDGENLGRFYKGCVINSFTMSASAGDAITISCDIIAQDQTFFSGLGSYSLSEPSHRPFVWSDSIVHFPSGTTDLDVKSWEFNIENNFNRDSAHVCNGSRVIVAPKAENRDYSFTITMDGNSTKAAELYGKWKSGGQIESNAAIQINSPYGTASGVNFITMSGCDVDAFDAPNPTEGTDEWSLTLIPKECSAEIRDQIEKYLAW